MISKVLVAVKPGLSKPNSVKRAKDLAHQLKFDLLLYSAVHEDQVSRSQYGTAEALKNIEQSMLKSELRRLNEIETHFTGLCLSVETEAEWQTPVAQGINSAAQAFGADLIVISESEGSVLGGLFMTHTDWEVIRGAQVPVLVCQNPNPRAYKKILAAVDPTHRHDPRGRLDNLVIALGEQLRDSQDAELYLGHVAPVRESTSIDAYMPPIDEFDNWMEFREVSMQKLAQKHNIPEDHTRVVSGSPAIGITDLAQALDADLVVMGALSRTFRSHRVLGNVPEKVLHKLVCDVLFVPLDGKP